MAQPPSIDRAFGLSSVFVFFRHPKTEKEQKIKDGSNGR